MTEQQRLTIRAELARRMGWKQVVIPDGEFKATVWELPACFPDDPVRHVWDAPNPFTNAADKDALVAWICANDYKSRFGDELLKALGIRDKFLGDRAPYEAITLAAAKALGIETE